MTTTERKVDDKSQLLAATISLEPGKTLAQVILPSSAEGSNKKLHIFAIGTDKGPIVLGP